MQRQPKEPTVVKTTPTPNHQPHPHPAKEEVDGLSDFQTKPIVSDLLKRMCLHYSL